MLDHAERVSAALKEQEIRRVMKKKSTKARNRQKWNFSYAQWGRYMKQRSLDRDHKKEIEDATSSNGA